MIKFADEIYGFLDYYCIGLDLSYNYKFKRFILQENKNFISFHISVEISKFSKFSGLFIITIYDNYIAINVLKQKNHFHGHEYNSFVAHSVDEFKNIIINNMDVAIENFEAS